MPAIRFNHYNLCAPRSPMEALWECYVDVPGFGIGYLQPFNNSGYWLYSGGRDILHLTETAPGETRPSNVATTFDHIAFTCVDSAAFKRKLDRAGIKYTEDTVPATGQIQLFFTGPARTASSSSSLNSNPGSR